MASLVKVREWKERLEKEARAARFEIEIRAADLAREAEDLRRRRHEFPDEAGAGADIAELAAWARHADLLRRRETGMRDRLEAMQEEIAAKRAAHLAARSEVESLKRLEERRARERKRLRERKVQEVIDDAATRRFLPGTGRKFPDAAPHPGHDPRPETDQTTAEPRFPTSAR